MIISASPFLATGVVAMGIILIGASACASDLFMRRLEGKLVPWKGK